MEHLLLGMLYSLSTSGRAPDLVHVIVCQCQPVVERLEPLLWCMLPPTATVGTLFWCMAFSVSHYRGAHILVHVISNNHCRGPVLVHGILCQLLEEPMFWCIDSFVSH